MEHATTCMVTGTIHTKQALVGSVVYVAPASSHLGEAQTYQLCVRQDSDAHFCGPALSRGDCSRRWRT